ncbi:MAG: hypothetical protein M1825_000782 [Sarcosagium campestre]|nr:MAG: hypothetical protein M1825_000782 [Sarcosagium campestre]
MTPSSLSRSIRQHHWNDTSARLLLSSWKSPQSSNSRMRSFMSVATGRSSRTITTNTLHSTRFSSQDPSRPSFIRSKTNVTFNCYPGRIPISSQLRHATTTASSPAALNPSQASTTTIPNPSSASNNLTHADLSDGLLDQPVSFESGDPQKIDWSRSFHGLSTEAFSKEAANVLLAPLPADDIEVKPDGILYLPEIKYRRILNQAFGPGAWGLAPRGETIVTGKSVTREYALLVHGRLVSIARGEMDYFSAEGIPTAVEGCKSNALMRCCKDLGVASELWDPRFLRRFMAEHAREAWVEHVVSKKKRKIWVRKDAPVAYPYKETKGFNS